MADRSESCSTSTPITNTCTGTSESEELASAEDFQFSSSPSLEDM